MGKTAKNILVNKIKNPIRRTSDRIFGMLRTYTTGPGPRDYRKMEKALLQGPLLRQAVWLVIHTNTTLCAHYTPAKNHVNYACE